MTTLEKNSWTDIVLGSLFILFGAAVLIATSGLPGSTYDPLGPAFMPRALGLCSMICSAVILYHGLRKRAAAKKETAPPETREAAPAFDRHPRTAFAAMVLVFLYIFALYAGLSGFRTLTVVFVLALGGMLMKAENRGSLAKKTAILVVLAVFLSFGLFHLFTQVFIVDLY